MHALCRLTTKFCHPHYFKTAVHGTIIGCMCMGFTNNYASVGGATRHTVVHRFVLHSFIHSFCPQAELRVGGKLSADTCNTCSTRCCLGIELIDFWFQSFVTLNGIAGLAQHCGTSLKIKLSTIVFFTACKTILYSR